MSSVNPTIHKQPAVMQFLQRLLKLPIISELISTFQSIQLAIVLIALLAVGTIIGVRFPQEGAVDPQQIEKAYGYTYQYFKTLGFFNVFSSFWFVTLQVLFFFSLLIGSFKWLKPAYLAATQVNFLPVSWLQSKLDAFSLSQPVTANTPEELNQQITQLLKKQGYKVHSQNNSEFYAHKGSITRLGPAIAHVGILLCLIAGFYGLLTGFKALHLINPKEPAFAIERSIIFNTNMPQPFWQGQVPQWKVAVDDFKIDFYKNKPNIPKQYYSSLRIVDEQGKTLAAKDISVNHPLIYDNVSIYQASYQPTGSFNVKINGQPELLAVNDKFNDRNVCVKRLPDGRSLILFPFFAAQDGVPEDFAVFFVRGSKTDVRGDGQMPPNTRLKPGQRATVEGIKVEYLGPQYSTGLQIKKAPEVGIMYFSYLIISIGAILCFFTQRQIWLTFRPIEETASQSPSTQQYEVLIYPKTNKGRFSFQEELNQLQQHFIQYFSKNKK